MDECKTGQHNCTKRHLVCVNVPGSYRCVTTTSWPTTTTTTTTAMTTRDNRTPDNDDSDNHRVSVTSENNLPATLEFSFYTPTTTTPTTTTEVRTTTTTSTKTLRTLNDSRTTDHHYHRVPLTAAVPSTSSALLSQATTTTTTTPIVSSRTTPTSTKISTKLSDIRTTDELDNGDNGVTLAPVTNVPATSRSLFHTTATTRMITTNVAATTTTKDLKSLPVNIKRLLSTTSIATSVLTTSQRASSTQTRRTTEQSTSNTSSTSTLSQPAFGNFNVCRPGYMLNQLTSTCEGDRFRSCIRTLFFILLHSFSLVLSRYK